MLRLYHDVKPGAMIRVALAPCSPLAVPKRVMEGSADGRAFRLPDAHPSLPDPRGGRLRLDTFGIRPVDSSSRRDG